MKRTEEEVEGGGGDLVEDVDEVWMCSTKVNKVSLFTRHQPVGLQRLTSLCFYPAAIFGLCPSGGAHGSNGVTGHLKQTFRFIRKH